MTEETPFDAGSVTHVRRARADARRSAAEGENAVRAMLADKAARALLWSFVETCGIFRQDFAESSGAMYFMAGQRNAGLRLWALIPDDLKAQMAAEQKEVKDA